MLDYNMLPCKYCGKKVNELCRESSCKAWQRYWKREQRHREELRSYIKEKK